MQLILIRHGQARFGTDDYDRLSDLGREQMQRLADHMRQLPERPGKLLHGSLQRQRESANLLRAAYSGNDTPPAVHCDARLDEYDIAGVFWGYLDDVLAARPALAPYRDSLNDNPQVFEAVYRDVMRTWLADPHPDSRGLQSWAAFQARVRDAVAALEAGQRPNGPVILVTSGAVVASLVGQALALDGQAILGLNRELYNSSISRLRLGGDGMTLNMFNAVPHLESADAERLLSRR
ncbi:histidine phosphatase family protein [Methylonatrum kenyense]|uniref:histidine phosphatase family protein n=1 Tax=Methylonatrum kenyense TaxID=455253 RepID=UPI0020BDAC16|nr:histidine phosphatase family protein [Methylonatrum kenyense]MCK8517246.1 histidine phosphatase family protein [Methylonatrum kenyense]